jgi:hypothetical protein
MASQGSDKSQDLKDKDYQPGEAAKTSQEKKKLGEQLRDVIQENVEKLYNDKFVPWLKKAVKGSLKTDFLFPLSEFGSDFFYNDTFHEMFVERAADDEITVGSRQIDKNGSHEEDFYPVSI